MLPTQGPTCLVKNAHRGTLRARPGFVGTASGVKTCNGLISETERSSPRGKATSNGGNGNLCSLASCSFCLVSNEQKASGGGVFLQGFEASHAGRCLARLHLDFAESEANLELVA